LELWHWTVGHGRRALWCAVSDMLETRVVLQTWLVLLLVLLLLLLHHLLVVVRCASRVSTVLVAALVVLIVVATALVRKVLRSLVFVRTAILLQC
jgi:hypothetical protein